MDRRQQKTRQAIFESFLSLLEKQSYAKLSVQKIIDGANVGRSTFYAHFQTKDDLLKSLCTEIFDHVFSAKLTREASHDFSGRRQDLSEEITHILYHLQDDRAVLYRILSRDGGEIFMDYFKQYLRNVFAGALGKRKNDVPREYLLDHTVSSFAETVRWWMKHGACSPEEIARFFFTALPFLAESSE